MIILKYASKYAYLTVLCFCKCLFPPPPPPPPIPHKSDDFFFFFVLFLLVTRRLVLPENEVRGGLFFWGGGEACQLKMLVPPYENPSPPPPVPLNGKILATPLVVCRKKRGEVLTSQLGPVIIVNLIKSYRNGRKKICICLCTFRINFLQFLVGPIDSKILRF